MNAYRGITPELKGILFTEVVPQLTPEINPVTLIRLGSIVRAKHGVELYVPLTDAFRKIQWVKLMAIEAIAIDEEITRQMEPNIIVTYPYGQMRHALRKRCSLSH